MAPPFDRTHMDCENVQGALSARADGEAAGMPETVIAWHLRTCPDCAAFETAIAGIGRPAGTGKSVDLSGRVVAMAGGVDRGGVWWGMRAALFVIAVGELGLAVPDLVARASGVTGDVHIQRHLGAFQIAYAVGLIVVALRPAKARALVPLTAALAAAMVGAAIVDIAQGVAPALGEAQHTLEIAGLLLVWMLAARRGWPGHARAAGGVDSSGRYEASRPLRPHAVRSGESRRGVRDRHSA